MTARVSITELLHNNSMDSTDVDALGYPYVPLRDKDTLHDAANWISETLHQDDFAYNSFGFWFNTKEDAMLFKLVWG